MLNNVNNTAQKVVYKKVEEPLDLFEEFQRSYSKMLLVKSRKSSLVYSKTAGRLHFSCDFASCAGPKAVSTTFFSIIAAAEEGYAKGLDPLESI